MLTTGEILKRLSNRTKHASEKCKEHVEMTALYLGHLWEAIPCHQTAEPAELMSYGRHTRLAHAPAKHPKDAAQTGASRWRLREKLLQEEGAE